MKKTLIKGLIAILTAAIPAAITGFAAYKAGEVSKEQEFNSQISQEVNIDNGDISGAISKLIEENKELRQEISQLEKTVSTYKDAEKGAEKETGKETEAASEANAMTNKDETQEASNNKTELKELPEVDSNYFAQQVPFTDSYGNNYEIGYEFNALYNGYAVFGLKGQYTTFSAKVACGEDIGTGTDMTMYIYKDNDELLDTIEHIDKTTETLEIGPYDITDARNLVIKTENIGNFNDGRCCLVEAYVQ